MERERQLERRSKNGTKTVSIIGYTNAGKTSLFNLLTGKKNAVNNALFVTLDSSTGKLFLPELQQEVLISDTIGFIKQLPPSLIEAFKSTLMESIHADVLLIVIDASDPERDEKIRVVEYIVKELNIREKKRIYVFNKMDKADGNDRQLLAETYEVYHPQFISVKTGEGIKTLVYMLENTLSKKPENPEKPRHVHVI